MLAETHFSNGKHDIMLDAPTDNQEGKDIMLRKSIKTNT